MFHKIKNVCPLPDMILHVEFINGSAKCYDVKPLMDKWEVFKDLAQGGLFDLVRVEAGGYGVVWNEYIDLACNELWENGYAVDSMKLLGLHQAIDALLDDSVTVSGT